MSIPALVEQAREWALATLTDTVHITRDGAVTYDDLGTETHAETVVFDGAGLVQLEQSASRTVTVVAGEQEVDAQSYVCKLDVATPVQAGDVVQVTASLDARHVGRRWRVTAAPSQGWAVLRRCTLDTIDPEGVA